MPTKSVDFVIIGAGAMGSATAWWLARQGHSVTVLEQFEAGHARGSSHGGSRIFRLAYPDADYVGLAVAALPLWRELEEEAGETLLEQNGMVDHGNELVLRRIAAGLDAHGAAYQWLQASESQDRWPFLRFGGPVLFHPDGGRCLAAKTVAACQRLAASHGADLHFETPVVTVDNQGDHALVHTAEHSWRATAVVVCAGAWLSRLLAGRVHLPDLAVTCEQTLHFRARDLADEDRWPSFIHHGGRPQSGASQPPPGDWYGLTTPSQGVKVGGHHSGSPVDPDNRPFSIEQEATEQAVAYVRNWLPGLDLEPVHPTRCLYTTTLSEDFVLDRVGPIVVGSPCSGHGFKFVPLLGKILAGLALGRPGPGPRFALPCG